MLTRVFEEKEHATEFLRGKVRAGTLLSYQNIEDNHRRDEMEGVFDSEHFAGLKATLKMSSGKTIALWRVKYELPWAEGFNVLCTTASYVDAEWIVPAERYDEVMDRYVRIPEAVMKLGDFAVCIHKPNEFIERVKTAADKLGVPMDCGFVNYGRHHHMPKGGPRDVGMIFCKREEHKCDREFRFSFESPQKVEEPLVLNVGDLSDIAKLFRTREINSQLSTTYREVAPGKRTRAALGWQDDL